MFKDKTIVCVNCPNAFVFTAKEQDYYARHLGHDGKPMREPKRCKDCRKLKRNMETSPFAVVMRQIRRPYAGKSDKEMLET